MKAQLLCAWCNGFLGWTETPSGEPSHGICASCRDKLLAEAGLVEEEDDEQAG